MDLTESPPLFCGSKRHSPKMYNFGEFGSRRPSFAPRGNSFDQSARDSQTILHEQRPIPLPHLLLEPRCKQMMTHSASMDPFPNKHISRVSSMIKRSCRSLEVRTLIINDIDTYFYCYKIIYLYRIQNFLMTNVQKKRTVKKVLRKLWLMVAFNIPLYCQ